MSKFLKYPVYPFFINQNFGDNRPCVKNFGSDTQTIVTGPDNTTCPVDYIKLYPLLGCPEGHTGLDIMAGQQDLYAACEGVVQEMCTEPARGLGIGIVSNSFYDIGLTTLYRVKTRYWHLKNFNVNIGDTVKVGDLLGVTDNTGYSSGNHLHFEVKPQIFDKGGSPKNAFPNNGFAGAINPFPFFDGEYANIEKPHYQFDKPIQHGNIGPDVYALQNILKYEGFFKAASTGFYGDKTAKALYDWQTAHAIAPQEYIDHYQGKIAGEKTLPVLNSIYAL